MIKQLIIFILCLKVILSYNHEIKLTGPGLQPKEIVMPARYFYVNFTSVDEKSYTKDISEKLAVEITGKGSKGRDCRVWSNILNRMDGTFIVRYKLYETCVDLAINIYFNSKHINNSPFIFEGPIQADQCVCPEPDIKLWLSQYGCNQSYEQIDHDLKYHKNVDMKLQVQKIVEKYHRPESTSFCHYVVKNNEIYRDCYGKHIGFNMFSDNILLSLSRKVILPDMELVVNLGDWPLVQRSSDRLAIFSWCGSIEALDIVMPTYDITESVLENMGRVTLDTLSVQGGVERQWKEREPRAVWRGRDSRLERLTLIDIARANPDLFNASLTNFFFFRDKEVEYGPKQPHISFFKFFDYKYQINVDGTVAAYRLAYLMAGGGMVLKQDSPYYEHFYRQLEPWKHYVPVARDLSDLKERVIWARENDEEAYRIAKNAHRFANDNLLPQHIICYHAVLFSEWSKRIKSEVTVEENMTHVTQPPFSCECNADRGLKDHEEL